MNTNSHQTARLPGRAMKYLLAWLLVLPLVAQKVDTHIPLGAEDRKDLLILSQQVDIFELRQQPLQKSIADLQRDLNDLVAQQAVAMKQHRAKQEEILAEHYLNPQEYGIDENTWSIFKVDEPTPRPER